MIVTSSGAVFRNILPESKSLKKIDRFSKLEEGWRFGEGIALRPEVRKRAEGLVVIAEYYGWENDVFPGMNGELLLEIEKAEDHYEFILEINGTVTAIRMQDGEDAAREGGLDDSDARDIIRFTAPQCDTYGYFILTSGNPETDVSTAWHSGRVPLRQTGFLSFIQSARVKEADQSVHTFKRFTRSGRRQLYSGNLNRTRSVLPEESSIPKVLAETSGVTTKYMTWEMNPQTTFLSPIIDPIAGPITESALVGI